MRSAAPHSDAFGCSAAHKGGAAVFTYLEQCHPAQYNDLILTGKLWTYLSDLNEQAQNRLDCIIAQMKETEKITEELKAQDQMAWVSAMNNIRNRAEEIVRHELIYDAKEVL